MVALLLSDLTHQILHLESGLGGLSCVSYNSYVNHYKKQHLSYSLTLCITRPLGRLCNPTDAEIGGIHSSLDYILAHKATYTQKRVIIATDMQSTLKALAAGPKRPYKYLRINTSPIWNKLWEVSTFVKHIILHYVPGHVGLVGNELANEEAKRAVTEFSIVEQDKVCITLSNLKCYLCKTLLDQWTIKTAKTCRNHTPVPVVTAILLDRRADLTPWLTPQWICLLERVNLGLDDFFGFARYKFLY